MYDIYPFLKDELFFCLFAHSHFFVDNLHFDGDTKCGLANSISFSLSTKPFCQMDDNRNVCMCVYVYVLPYVCMWVQNVFFYDQKKQWRTMKRRRK